MNKANQKGFTLIEVMVAAAILAFGLVHIFQALFTSLDIFRIYSHSLAAQVWIDEKIWETKDELRHNETLLTGTTTGRIDTLEKAFDWEMSIDSIDPEQGLYRLHLIIFWQEGNRKRDLSRMVYALMPFKAELVGE